MGCLGNGVGVGVGGNKCVDHDGVLEVGFFDLCLSFDGVC